MSKDIQTAKKINCKIFSHLDMGPFKYYVSKKEGGWGWSNADVSKKYEKKNPREQTFLCMRRKKNKVNFFGNFFPIFFFCGSFVLRISSG